MSRKMDKIVQERDGSQDEINNKMPENNQQNPLIEQIDKWENMTIEKVKQVAAEARQQASELLNAKWIKINSEFISFSQELVRLIK